MPSRGGDGGDEEEDREERESVLMSSESNREGRPRGRPFALAKDGSRDATICGWRMWKQTLDFVVSGTDPKMPRPLVTVPLDDSWPTAPTRPC